MFSALVNTELVYNPPWERETLDSRLSSIQGERPRVAWLYEKPDTSTCLLYTSPSPRDP